METLPQPVQSLAKYVTVICDHDGYPLTPHDEVKPARLHDVVPGRSSDSLDSWLDAQPQEFRDNIEVVAMDGFTGYATAVDKNLPQATKVMDPFHVVHLGLDKLTGCRQHIQQSIYGRRGRSGDPLYGARRTLMTGAPLLTEFHCALLVTLFADERYLPVQVTWFFTQEIMAAYKHPDKRQGKKIMVEVIRILPTRLKLVHNPIVPCDYGQLVEGLVASVHENWPRTARSDVPLNFDPRHGRRSNQR